MKKLMLGVGVATIALSMATPSMAREMKELVGYVHTETTVNDRDAEFYRMDANKDGIANFKEFQNAALLSNEYEMFKMNDANNDGVLSMDEYRNFSKMGPAHGANNDNLGMSRYNFNVKKANVQ